MDQTLNKLWETFVEVYNAIYNKKEYLTRSQLLSYTIPEVLGIPKDKWFEVADKVFKSPDVFYGMPVYEDAIPVLETLNKKSELYIATTPWASNLDCCKEKILWMKKYFPFIKTEQIIFVHNKGLLKGHALIDDSPHNLASFSGDSIAFTYPYNRGCRATGRITEWKNALKVLNYLL
jgi:5'(3')-deoxyribonucleotidase